MNILFYLHISDETKKKSIVNMYKRQVLFSCKWVPRQHHNTTTPVRSLVCLLLLLLNAEASSHRQTRIETHHCWWYLLLLDAHSHSLHTQSGVVAFIIHVGIQCSPNYTAKARMVCSNIFWELFWFEINFGWNYFCQSIGLPSCVTIKSILVFVSTIGERCAAMHYEWVKLG